MVSDLEAGKRDKPTFLGYTTVIDRVIEGFPVRGSYAWARFNGDDDVISEEVYWPELPEAVVEDAQSLSKELADSIQEAAFLKKIPTELQGQRSEVAIFHSPFFQTAFESFAAVGFPDIAPESRFLADGTEVRFGYERAVPTANAGSL